MTFGQNLKRLRLAAGLTQLQLAQALHYTQQTSISLWERTAAVPTPDVITRVATALGCSPADLLQGVVTAYDRLRGGVTPIGAPAPPALTDEQRALLELWDRIRRDARRHVLALLRTIATEYPD